MAQFTHTNKLGKEYNLWQATVKLANGNEATVQYFLPTGKKPRTAATTAATAIKPGYEIHEIGQAHTPLVSKKVKPATNQKLIDNFIKNAKIS